MRGLREFVPRSRRAAASVTSAAALFATALATVLVPVAAEAAEVRPLPGSGAWTVDGRGNGHGHGLSQYGARGAAQQGLTASQILAFYYPGTALATASGTNIRVNISAVGANPQVKAESGLSVTGVSGTLPTDNTDLWRLVPYQNGFTLDRHQSTGWSVYKILGSTAVVGFRASDGAVSLFRTSGYREYRGLVAGVRVGSGAIVVNTLPLDDYVRGVVPSEMPASWEAPAVQAQAVAARSYSRYYVEHPRDANYDICDTTACQVYGGRTAEASGSNDAVAATAGKILTYNGSTIFAEFSASNGGITSSGNQPYFVTKTDPYDTPSTGDPYFGWVETVYGADVATSLGLTAVSQISITEREGGGQWGGLVKTAVVTGTATDGSAASLTVSGARLAGAMGLPYRYFFIRPTAPRGNAESFAMTALHNMEVKGWAVDPSDTSQPTKVAVYVDSTATVFTADKPRPDVQQALGTVSANHGFDVSVTVPGGSHQVCAWALTIDGSVRQFLACKDVTVAVDPLGHMDQVKKTAPGKFTLMGWTFDPDRNGGPGSVNTYVDNRLVLYATGTPLDRSDVKSYFGIANSTVGFTYTLAVPSGTHKVCVFAPNLSGAGKPTTLYCSSVTS